MMIDEQGHVELVLIITATMIIDEQGHVELAISKPKGAGCETPTSEPGFSITDQVL